MSFVPAIKLVNVVEDGLLGEIAARGRVVAATLLVEQAQELRMLAHGGEIEGPIELPCFTGDGSVVAGDIDGATFRELVRLARAG